MKKFPFIELGIIIATFLLLYILIYPSYVKNKDMNNKYNVISNVYDLKAAFEMYATLDNNGVLPDKATQAVIEYLSQFGVKNPYSNEPYKFEDITVYMLENPIEVADNTLSGKHGIQRGIPGTFGLGIYIPDLITYNTLRDKENKTKDEKKAFENLVLEVRKYTIIGFGSDSLPVTMKDMSEEKTEVFFLSGEKTIVDN